MSANFAAEWLLFLEEVESENTAGRHANNVLTVIEGDHHDENSSQRKRPKEAPKKPAHAVHREQLRDKLMKRLEDEGADDLIKQLSPCGDGLGLTCTHCGNRRVVTVRCERRWCPVCAYYIAAARVAKYKAAAQRFAYPLFVTLTVRNSEDPELLTHVKKSWQKFRRRKIIADRCRSGIVGYEMTNKGNGWHPHLHALLDCRWLAVHVPEPRRSDPPEEVTRKLHAAQRELINMWADVVGQEHASVFVRRANAAALIETLKYAIKAGDLVQAQDEIAPMIRIMDQMRMISTFGEIRKEMQDENVEPDKPQCKCEQCGEAGCMITDRALSFLNR